MIKLQHYFKRFQYDDILDVSSAALPWGRLCGKTVMISDASSLLGFYITAALLLRNDVYDEGIKIAAVVRDNMKCSARFGDLLMRDDIKVIVRRLGEELNTDVKADYIIHLPDYIESEDPAAALDYSLGAVKRILGYAEKCSPESVLVCAGAEVYGEIYNGKDFISEDEAGYIDRLDTANSQSVGQRAGENLCALYADVKKLPVKLARLCCIYGPSLEENGMPWNKMLSSAVMEKDIILDDSGCDTFSLCYVSDAAEALLTILLCGECSYPYNISSEYSNVSVRDFAKAEQSIMSGSGIKLVFSNPSDEKERHRSYFSRTPEVLDNKRLKDLGWVGRTTLKEGIGKSVRILKG